MNKYTGGSFEDFLKEEGIFEEVTERALKRLKVLEMQDRESQKLLNSVREKYNQTDELDRRKEEAAYGLGKHEQAFVDKLPKGSSLLDIGCASGRLCLALAKLRHTVTGIDVAEKQIEQAQRIAERENIDVTFLHYKPPTLPFPDASFAAAFMENVYCYIPHRDARIAFLEEVARVLYPKGQLFLSNSVLDGIFNDYEPIYDDNYQKFASDYETLEEGDNFYSEEKSVYVHHFFADDLKAELKESSFRLLNSSVKNEKVYCVLLRN